MAACPSLIRPPFPHPQPQIYLRFGTPALRPFPAALGPWLQGIAVSTEFYHVLLSTLMVSYCNRKQQMHCNDPIAGSGLEVGLIGESGLHTCCCPRSL